ncbi:Maltose O-acetyltransferase [Anoxybacillus sp. BCO1]|nr:Maltose O-acetyltransferase [Anoxybacillus sp. BCO1]
MKSEKEKMLSGQLYRATDPELVKEREHARRLTRLFNQTLETEHERRVSLLKELFGSTGENLYIEPLFIAITDIIFMLGKTFLPIFIASF